MAKHGKMRKEKITKARVELEEETRRDVVSSELAESGTAENADLEAAPTQTGEIEEQPPVEKVDRTKENSQDRGIEEDTEGFQLYLNKQLKRKYRRESSSSSSDSPNEQKALKIVTDDEDDSDGEDISRLTDRPQTTENDTHDEDRPDDSKATYASFFQ